MEAAVEQVTAGNVPNVDGTVSTDAQAPSTGSKDSTPAPTTVAPPTPVSAATLQNSTEPMTEVLQTGSAQTTTGPQTVQDAVQPLQGVQSEKLVGAGGETEQKDKSLMEE